MSKLSFVKYQGIGNDFILFDDRNGTFDPSLVASLCHRRFGIGADGVILLQKDPKAHFAMRIFNSDGSEAESCGNGLRCLMRFILDLGCLSQNYTIATIGGLVEVGHLNEKIFVQMPLPVNVKQLYIDDKEIHFTNTGVPHAVVFVTDLEGVNVGNEGKWLRHHAEFQPGGSNVNFAKVEDGKIKIRTYERGVEGETWACGTGAAAVAYVAKLHYGMGDEIEVNCRGGKLEFAIESSIKMFGDAKKVFEGSISF